MSDEYESHGDVNPLDYGGIWIKKNDDGTYDIIRYEPETNTIGSLEVDITDSWLDRAGIMSYIGMTEDNFDEVQFAIGATDYYSWDNFGYVYVMGDRADVIENLAYNGIMV